MNPQTTYNNYLNQYGEVEGKEKFLDLCEEMEYRDPNNKEWIEIARKILNNDWEKLKNSKLDEPFKGWDK